MSLGGGKNSVVGWVWVEIFGGLEGVHGGYLKLVFVKDTEESSE